MAKNTSKVDTHPAMLSVLVEDDKGKEHSVLVPSVLAQSADNLIRICLNEAPAIKEAQAKVDSMKSAQAAGMLELGKECIRLANKDLAKAGSYFAGATAQAEHTIEREHAPKDGTEKGPKISTLIPLWRQYKSTVKRSLDLKIDLTEVSTEKATVNGKTVEAGTPAYPTMTAVRNAVAERQPKVQPATAGATGGNSELAEAFSKVRQSPKVQAALLQLAATLVPITQESVQLKAGAILLDAALEIREEYQRFTKSGIHSAGTGAETAAAEAIAS